jgi:XTP/dITP diphosphohydrolase
LRHLLIATSNAGKVREFREMLDPQGAVASGDRRFAWDDLSRHPGFTPVEETGDTFLANACLKAEGYAKQFNTWALADDSGLEVDALDGKPGVHSARWAELNGIGKGDADNNKTLLAQLETESDERRTGRFVCVLALADPAGRIILTARDSVEGRILRSARGSNGFGYDPLYYIEPLGRTTAELSPREKHEVSHRGKALRRLRAMMERAGLFSEDDRVTR